MSTYESSYPPMLQGVSQQQPQERLPGQVSAQDNMISDPVTGVRRRPGLAYLKDFAMASVDHSHILTWFTGIALARAHIILNTLTGTVKVFSEKFDPAHTYTLTSPYLVNADPSRIRAASVNNALYLVNLDVKPTAVTTPTGPNPAHAGFFYIAAGGFGRKYTVTVAGMTAEYTTPGGTGSGDAAASTPETIAENLQLQLATQALIGGLSITIVRDGPYVYVQHTTPIAVTTTSSSTYIVVSRESMLASAGLLPARLPAAANLYRCRVGSGESAQYYQYYASSGEWLECASYDSPTAITNMPVSIEWDGASVVINSGAYEGRFAGDSTNNPAPKFIADGFTGIGTHQGRLVLLSGPMVAMSASGNPRRFFRSTVTNVISSDPIEIGSSMLSAAAYEWAVPFQKDLLLFSRAYQAVVPSGNSVVTPSNATVVPTSSHEVDTTSSPVTLGRTLLYASPRSAGYFGAMEMIPSNFTDSQYISQDSTPHLPRAMQGKCRFMASSGSSNLVVVAPSDGVNSLWVHEYQWDGDTKVQQAWHRWVFKYPVASAYFAADFLVVVFAQNGTVVLASMDPRSGSYGSRGSSVFLDLHAPVQVLNRTVTLPTWLVALDPIASASAALAVRGGDLAGDSIGIEARPGTLYTVPSFVNADAHLGFKYRSSIDPGPPVVRDFKDRPISTGKATLQRYTVTTEDSDEFMVTVSDKYGVYEALPSATLSWESPELDLNRGQYARVSTAVVPCRTDLRTTGVEFATDGTGELNILSLEYVAKYSPKITRR